MGISHFYCYCGNQEIKIFNKDMRNFLLLILFLIDTLTSSQLVEFTKLRNDELNSLELEDEDVVLLSKSYSKAYSSYSKAYSSKKYYSKKSSSDSTDTLSSEEEKKQKKKEKKQKKKEKKQKKKEKKKKNTVSPTSAPT